jgi:hypothetical protein
MTYSKPRAYAGASQHHHDLEICYSLVVTNGWGDNLERLRLWPQTISHASYLCAACFAQVDLRGGTGDRQGVVKLEGIRALLSSMQSDVPAAQTVRRVQQSNSSTSYSQNCTTAVDGKQQATAVTLEMKNTANRHGKQSEQDDPAPAQKTTQLSGVVQLKDGPLTQILTKLTLSDRKQQHACIVQQVAPRHKDTHPAGQIEICQGDQRAVRGTAS